MLRAVLITQVNYSNPTQSDQLKSSTLSGVHKYISKGGLLTLIQCLLSFETDTISSVFAQDKEETLAMMHVDTSEAKATS